MQLTTHLDRISQQYLLQIDLGDGPIEYLS
jgi:hypothetical protein